MADGEWEERQVRDEYCPICPNTDALETLAGEDIKIINAADIRIISS